MSLSLLWHLLKITGKEWVANHASRLGAALAFYSILSLSPLFLLILAGTSAIWGAQEAQGHIIDQMNRVIGSEGADVVAKMLDAASTDKFTGVVAGFISVASLLISASAVFGELQDAFNIIWHAPARVGQPIASFLRERLLSIVMVIGSGFLLMASVFVSAALAAASHFVTGLVPTALVFMKLINFLVSSGIVVLLFAVIFKTIPDLNIPWKSVWPGSFLTAALFIIGKGLIALYLGHAGIGSSYGAAGSIVILLVWIYYSAQILFFGAEFTYIYSTHFKIHPQSCS
jgi:membrane protein